MSDNTPALSVRQPWAWLILHAGKDVENRSWPTKFRGRFLIHAAKGMTRGEYAEAFDTLDEIDVKGRIEIPKFEELERGGVVGEAEIVGCVEEHESPWFAGRYGFVLRNVRALPFRACKGALGFFKVEFL